MPKKSDKKKAKPAKPAKAEVAKLPQMPSAKDIVVEKLRDRVPASIDERWAYVEKNHAAAAEAMFNTGAALLTLRQDIPHGEFGEALEKRGIGRRTAYNMMRVARSFVQAYARLKSLSASKLYALAEAGLSDEDYDPETDSIDGIQVDEIDTLSSRELKTKLRKAHSLSKSQDNDIRKAEDTIAGLRKDLNPMPDDYTAALKVCREIRFGGALAVGAVDRIDFDKTTDDRIKREAFLAVQSVAMEAVTFITKCFRDENFMHLDMDKGVPMQLISWLKKYEGQLNEFNDNDSE